MVYLFYQHCYYNTDGELIIGGMQSHKYSQNRCLVDPGSGNTPALQECHVAKQNKMHMHWDFKQVRHYLKQVSQNSVYLNVK